MRVPHPPSISQRFRSAHQRFIIGPMAATCSVRYLVFPRKRTIW